MTFLRSPDGRTPKALRGQKKRPRPRDEAFCTDSGSFQEPQVGIEPTTARHQDCADNPQLSPHQHNRENGSGEQDPDPDSSPASKRQRNGNRPPSVAGAIALAGGIRRQLLAAGLTSRDLVELAKALDPIRASRRDLLVLFALADVIDHADPDAPADLSRCSCGRAKRISFCDVTPADGAGITAARWICDVCEAPANPLVPAGAVLIHKQSACGKTDAFAGLAAGVTL